MAQVEVIRAVSGYKEKRSIPGKPTLEQLQGLVGGYIEPVYLDDGRVMLADEDGFPKKLTHNEEASRLAHTFIVGDVVILNEQDFQ